MADYPDPFFGLFTMNKQDLQKPDNMRGCGETIFFSFILLAGMLAGSFITYTACKSSWEHHSVEQGHAEYNPKTGRWQWKILPTTPEKPEAPDAR